MEASDIDLMDNIKFVIFPLRSFIVKYVLFNFRKSIFLSLQCIL